MRMTGREPARRETLEPKSSASANSATSAQKPYEITKLRTWHPLNNNLYHNNKHLWKCQVILLAGNYVHNHKNRKSNVNNRPQLRSPSQKTEIRTYLIARNYVHYLKKPKSERS